MHCPRCGQQQLSPETKFCSRCGFQLGLVAELLANDGYLPQLAELYKGKAGLFTKKNGMIFALIWFILFVLMFPALFGVLGGEELAGLSAVFGVFSTMIMMVGSVAFLKSSSSVKNEKFLPQPPIPHASPLYGGHARTALPPQQSQPASTYMPPQGTWRASDTGELAVPPSVTDGTTKLLTKDEKESF